MTQFIKHIHFNDKYKLRTKAFAVHIIRFYSLLDKKTETQVIGKQMLRSGTSVAANFRAASRARSQKEFYAKLSIVIEECDETLFWLELLDESKLHKPEDFDLLSKEALELLKVFSSLRKKLKQQT